MRVSKTIRYRRSPYCKLCHVLRIGHTTAAQSPDGSDTSQALGEYGRKTGT